MLPSRLPFETLNPYKRAFQEPINLVGLAVLAASSFATWSPVPDLVGLVAEAAYLLFVPTSSWYRRRLSYDAAKAAMGMDQGTPSTIAQDRANAVGMLSPGLQSRYRRLTQLRAEIEQKVREQVSFTPEILSKLDRLQGQFLDFATSRTQFVAYLQRLLGESSGGQPTIMNAPPPGATGRRANPAYGAPQRPLAHAAADAGAAGRGDGGDEWVTWAVGRIQSQYGDELNRLDPEAETDPSLKELKQKRADVLARRSEYVGKLGKTIINITLQLQLIEDTFGLIDDEVSAKNPEQVLGEIDNLMLQTDTLTKSLAEAGEMFQAQRAGG